MTIGQLNEIVKELNEPVYLGRDDMAMLRLRSLCKEYGYPLTRTGMLTMLDDAYDTGNLTESGYYYWCERAVHCAIN